MNTQGPRLAVVYLARGAEGTAPLRKFRDSYLSYPAGLEHELVVAYKGYAADSDIAASQSVLSGVEHRSLVLPDDGFDIGAYLRAAETLEADYLCFLNTFTEIRSADWLQSLYRHAADSHVGLVGAMGSYESLR